MTAPNRNTLWAEILVDELLANGVDAVCIAPGSRSTPLTVAAARADGLTVYTHLDERSAAYFALGRSRRSGSPTALICTSGTAAANFHPAVMEANEGRVPLIVLTADRPPELQDSGANQTTDQKQLYGNAVRYHRTLPEPEPEPRKLRSLRVIVSRAVDSATNVPAGPVHLNVPFRKPLEPVQVDGDVPDTLRAHNPEAVRGRNGPYVETTRGRQTLTTDQVDSLAERLDDAVRGLIVCGPTNSPSPEREALASLARETGFPVLADPLSGQRFGPHQTDVSIAGGYDSYLENADWPEPDVVFRFGASPTSKTLRKYLAGIDTTQVLIDPAGAWREAEFTATDLVIADPTTVAKEVASRSISPGDTAYRERFESMEERYWSIVRDTVETQWFEGAIAHVVTRALPDPCTCFVSNSMPVRDFDRFAAPREAKLTVLGNRGVSGIDGIVSSGLGAKSAIDEPLVLVLGDLAFYHDMNGLLALERFALDVTIVLIDNDGGGIFHKLPIESFDPPFTSQFRTPHGLDFSPSGELYSFSFERASDLDEFTDSFEAAVGSEGTDLISVQFDSENSHQKREQLHETVIDRREEFF